MSLFAEIASAFLKKRCYRIFCFRIFLACVFAFAFPGGLRAAESADPAQEFLLAYQNFQQAERLERAGKRNEAITKYRYAENILNNLSSRNPDWQQPVVDYRLHKVRDSLARLTGSSSGGDLENGGIAETIAPVENTASAETSAAPAKAPSGAIADQATEQTSEDSPSISITPPATKKTFSDQEMTQLQKQLKKTELELQKTHSDLNEKTTELDHSKVVIVDMKSQLEKAERQVTDLKSDLTKIKIGQAQREAALQQSVQTLEGKVDALTADQEVVLEENKQLQDHLKLATDSLVAGFNAKQHLEQLQVELNTEKNASAALHQKLLIAENERDSLNDLNMTLKKQILEATTSLSAVEKQAQEAKELRAQINKLHVEDAEKNKQLVALQENAKKLEESQKALTSDLQKKNLEAQSNEQTWADARQVLEEKLKKATDQVSALQKVGSDVTALHDQIAAMKKEQQEAVKRLAEATAARDALEKEQQQTLADAATQSQIAKSERDELQNQKLELEKQLAEASEKMKAVAQHDSSSELAVQEEIARYKKELQENSAKFVEQEKKITELEKAQPVKDQLLVAKEKELADARISSDQLQKDLAVANQKLSALQAEVQLKDDRYNELKKQLDQKNEEQLALKKNSDAHSAENKAVAENELLKGIVIRELKAEAKRQQIKKLITEDLEKLKVNSVTLSDELKKLAKPTKLTPEEKGLFKDMPAPAASLDAAEEGDDSLMLSVAASKKENHAAPNAPQNAKNNSLEDEKKNDSEQHRELIAKAKEQFEHQNYFEAEKSFQDALALVPDDYLTLSNLGVVEFQLGKMTEAESALKKAVALDHKKSFALTTLGIVHYRQEKMEEAEKDLRQAIAINDQDFTAHNYLGIVLAASGKGKAGESEIMKALEINPQYADAHFNLAVIYATSKPPAKEMAKTHYTKAMALGAPSDQALEKLLN